MGAFVTGLGLFAVFWSAGAAVCWLAVRRQVAPLIACTILATIALVDLWRVDQDFYDTLPIDSITSADPTANYLRQQPEPFRVRDRVGHGLTELPVVLVGRSGRRRPIGSS
jgi:hypothetical protein